MLATAATVTSEEPRTVALASRVALVSWPSRGLMTGPPRGPNWGVVHRARPRAPLLVLMCWIMSNHILEQVGTARGALGRARCTTPQFGPLGGPVSRPERANFEATVRGRKCGSRKDHYSPG